MELDIYHSYWDLGWNGLNREVYNMHKLSVLTALESYGNIHLITTPKGKALLGSLPYTSIEVYDEELPVDLTEVWSLSKLYAYRQICRKNRPFLHIDYDVFLFKKLPVEFEQAEILVQHTETGQDTMDYYALDLFFNNCKNLYLGSDKINYAYNMGIFGGHRLDVINFYCEETLRLLKDKENIETYWKTDLGTKDYSPKAVVLEQWYLACCLANLRVDATTLLKMHQSHETLSGEATNLGYCHVWGDKHNSTVHRKIKNRIFKLEKQMNNTKR